MYIKNIYRHNQFIKYQITEQQIFMNNHIENTCCTPYKDNYYVLINDTFQEDKTCTFTEINNKQKQFNETSQVHFIIRPEVHTII